MYPIASWHCPPGTGPLPHPQARSCPIEQRLAFVTEPEGLHDGETHDGTPGTGLLVVRDDFCPQSTVSRVVGYPNQVRQPRLISSPA
jgi:hypothetical protein